MNMRVVSRRVKRLILALSISGALLMSGAISASAATARQAAPAIPASAVCAAHDWCAYSNYDFNLSGGGTEWVWSNYSYNVWYYVGKAQNDQWHSWSSGRGWLTGIGYSYPESSSNVWACVGGGSRVAYPGNYPGTSISEAGSASSVNFWSSNNVECP
jgi:hypothetical protein